MPVEHCLELSIIVPVLNEAGRLPCLFESLSRQTGTGFEVIVSDGGSRDGTCDMLKRAGNLPFDLRLVRAPSGRACQMNAAAVHARGDLLLFLHADSLFPDPDALARAVESFKASHAAGTAVAARFALRFRHGTATPSLAYFFYEAKARLDRPDCIRGDQGFLLPRTLYDALGGFDDSLPFLEDLRLAASVAEQGEWMLLPAEISTSARRFETEGLWERQVLNAIIVNAHVTGWSEFFVGLPGLYRCHAETGRLLLFPVLDSIRMLLDSHPPHWRRAFWLATGRHVAANTWQLFFWLDVRRAFLSGLQPSEIDPRRTLFFHRRLRWVVRLLPVQILAGLLVWVWHRTQLLRERRPPRETS